MPKMPSKPRSNSRLGVLRSKESGNGSDVADWGSVDAKWIQQLVAITSRLGGAVRFGYTRDGGAYSVGVYLDDDRETLYFRPTDDVNKLLEQLCDQLENV